MKIPNVNDLVDIEHGGRDVRAIVTKVEPDPASPLFYLITLKTDAAFAKGDECYWSQQFGSRRFPATVPDVKSCDGISEILLRAVTD